MNHKTGAIITKNGKTGTIIDRARIYQCWEIKWEDETYSIERDETLKALQPMHAYPFDSRPRSATKAKSDKDFTGR